MPRTTVEGATFIAPSGWSITVRGQSTVLEAPEAGSRIALIDVHADTADAAVAVAWAAYNPPRYWALKRAAPQEDRDGWVDQKQYVYETSPGEHRTVAANAARHDKIWTVTIFDMDQAVAEKRASQVGLIFSRLLPRDYQRETFAGKTAHKLDAERIAALTAFIDEARDTLGVPAIAIGIVQDGKTVFADGFGSRELGKPGKPDADTLFMIASNTKALTTLLLARLVDEKRLTWDTPVTRLMPSFKLGDEATTSSVLVKHLICACTGLPRQDLEWLMEFKGATPASSLKLLGTMQPTSKFGEMFQYSNLLAAAAGYVAAYVIAPRKELGAGYDAAMQAEVFGPLGMTSTTFDYARALRGNHAGAYGLDLDGNPAPALMAVNYAAIPVRPAGAAWSNVHDMLRYVEMELARGKLPGGKRYIGEEALLARQAPQVAMTKDQTYGMGLMVDRTWGIPVVHHGGDLVGYHSDMIWLPEHGVGAVILTNSEAGVIIRNAFRRKLLEALFDGQPLADAELASAGRQLRQSLASERERLTVPADDDDAGKLAARYHSDALGDIAVIREHGTTYFDVGEWKAPVASRKNPDGSVSFVIITPGLLGLEAVVGAAGGKRTLVIRDAQHEYTFVEQ
ncbi:MAG TPA: serine hydrolase domain-containing protein [Kofleriaceae bacterium]|nr:serine hydrolase domain-containing protein [Kofleriaceae bacterium]